MKIKQIAKGVAALVGFSNLFALTIVLVEYGTSYERSVFGEALSIIWAAVCSTVWAMGSGLSVYYIFTGKVDPMEGL